MLDNLNFYFLKSKSMMKIKGSGQETPAEVFNYRHFFYVFILGIYCPNPLVLSPDV